MNKVHFSKKSNESIFIVNQNPKSKYDDKEGLEYEYPLSIPNGRNIKKGDILVFNISKKIAVSLKLGNATLSGIARVKSVIEFDKDGRKMAKATYLWYRKFEKHISFDEIGGDVRNNKNNSINRVPIEVEFSFVLDLLRVI